MKLITQKLVGLLFLAALNPTTALAQTEPKVEYFDSFITAEDCTNIRTTAKEIQVPEKQFVAWLLKNKYLYRTAKGYLMPYAKKSNEGLFIVKDFYYGYGQIAHHTLITPNGKLLFMRLASRIRESA